MKVSPKPFLLLILTISNIRSLRSARLEQVISRSLLFVTGELQVALLGRKIGSVACFLEIILINVLSDCKGNLWNVTITAFRVDLLHSSCF